VGLYSLKCTHTHTHTLITGYTRLVIFFQTRLPIHLIKNLIMKLKFKYTASKKFVLHFEKETLGELTAAVKNFIQDTYGDYL